MKKNGQWQRLPDQLSRGDTGKVTGLVGRDRSADGRADQVEAAAPRSNVLKIL